MADLINEIISEEAFKQLEEANKGLAKAVSNVIKVAEAAKTIQFEFKGAKDLVSLSDSMAKSVEHSKTMSVSLDGLKTSGDKVSAVMAVMNGHSKEWITNLKVMEAAETQSAKTALESARLKTEASKQATEAKKQETESAKKSAAEYVALAKAESEEARKTANDKMAAARLATEAAKQGTEAAKQEAQTKMAEAKASADVAKQKEIETRYTIALAKEQERIEKNRDKAVAQLEREQSAYYQLNQEYKEAAANAQDLAAKKFMLERDQKGAVAGTYDYQVRQSEIERLSPTLKAAQQNAMGLHTALLEVEQAVGKSQRNVGNYNSAVMAMSQILREAPSFAYSFATGLLAISNNIPILVDEVERLKTVNEGLKATGEKTIPIWKTLMGAITSPSGLITIATSAITIFAARMAMAGGAMSEAEQQAKKLRESFFDLSATIQDNLAKELQKTEVLFKTAGDMGASYEARVGAINELLKLYPELLANLSQEAALNGRVADSQQAVADIIAKRAHSDELGKQIDIMSKQRNDILKKIEEWKQDETAFGTTWRFVTGDRNPLGEMEKQVDVFDKKISDLQDTLKLVNQQIGYMMNPKHDGRILSDIDADIKAQERLRDTTDATTKSHKDAISELKKLQEERAAYLGQDPKKPKKGQDLTNETLKAQQNFTKALAEETQKRILVESSGQKQIYEDETKGLSERIQAYRSYQQMQLDIKNVGIDSEIMQNELALDAIAKIEKKSVDKRSGEEQKLLLNKGEFLMKSAALTQEYSVAIKQNAEETTKGINSIYDKEVKYRLSALEKIKVNNDSMMQGELETLQQKYGTEILSEEVYQQKVQAVKDKYAKKQQRDFIGYLKEQIDALEKQGVDVSALNAALDKAQADMAKSDNEADKRKRDLKVENLKKVKDMAIQFAEEGMAAIVAIQDAQFEQQQIQLNKQKKSEDIYYEDKRRAIEASAGWESDKAAKLQDLNAQQAASESAMREKQKQLDIAKAKFDRDAAIANIIAKGAEAIAATLPMYANPATVPFAIAQDAIIAGITAAQIAKAASAPLPQYRMGTDYHKGGGFIAGDGGEKELIAPPNKAAYWSNQFSTLYSEAAGTKVIPMSKIVKQIGQFAHVTNQTTHAGYAQSQIPQVDTSEILNGLRGDIGKMKDTLAYVIQRSRPIINIKSDNTTRIDKY
jgi:hypothetical protein